jgi:hypothetical protein
MQNASVCSWLATALTSQARHHQAELYFRCAVAAEPRNPDFRVTLGILEQKPPWLEAAIARYHGAPESSPFVTRPAGRCGIRPSKF